MSTLDQRCPQCAALVRGGTGWCTLCHADLRPAPEPERVPEPVTTTEVVEVAEDVEVEGLVTAGVAPRTGGKHAKHAKPAARPVADPSDTAPEVQDYTDLMVDIDPAATATHGLSPQDVVQALLQSNVILPAGAARMGGVEYDVMLNNSPNTIAEFGLLPIKIVGGAPAAPGCTSPTAWPVAAEAMRKARVGAPVPAGMLKSGAST